MNKKQIVGLVVAALVFVFVGSTSVFVNTIARKQELKSMNSLKEMFADQSNTVLLPDNQYIGVVEVQGTIINSDTSGLWGDTATYNHQAVLSLIDQYMYSGVNKGILLYVNSPGGSVYDSDELYLKLKEYKKVTARPIWVYMADQACSGAYYISMAADKIYENRNGMTGSIGVIMSMSNYEELYKKLGIEQIDITSGENKTIGSPAKAMSKEQKEILQSIVDESYEQFVGIVAEGRNMSNAKVKELADGRIYTPKQALANGLIDKIGTYEEMVKDYQAAVGSSVEIFSPERQTSLWSSLMSLKSLKPQSDAEMLQELMESQGSGVPMYVASPGK